MRVIMTEKGEVKELMRILKCSRPAIERALRYKTKTPLAVRARHLALKRGAIEMEPVKNKKSVEIETSFNTAHNRMIQTFSTRVRVIVENYTGGGKMIIGVEVDGVIKRKYDEEMKFEEYLVLLEEVEKIAEQL